MVPTWRSCDSGYPGAVTLVDLHGNNAMERVSKRPPNHKRREGMGSWRAQAQTKPRVDGAGQGPQWIRWLQRPRKRKERDKFHRAANV